MNHAFQHLCRGDHPFTKQSAFSYQIFLDIGKLLKRHFYAEIATADHDAFAFLADFVDVVDAGTILNLRNNRDVFAAVFGKERLEVDQILPR